MRSLFDKIDRKTKSTYLLHKICCIFPMEIVQCTLPQMLYPLRSQNRSKILLLKVGGICCRTVGLIRMISLNETVQTVDNSAITIALSLL